MHNIYDLEAEKCVLSIMITEPNKREYVFEKLKRKDFYLGWHKDIFSAILELSRENTNVDPITVINKMEAMGFDTESNNGIVGVVEIVNAVAFPSNIENYCKIVKDKSDTRNLLFILDNIKDRAYKNEDYDKVLESIEGQIFELSQNENRTGLTHIKDTLTELIEILDDRSKNKGSVTGIPTGFSDLDRILLGMQRKDLILLAARPSVGKTALAVNIALNAAKSGSKVAIFSLEMSKTQLAQRMLSSLSLVNLKQLISGDITEWEDIFEASSIIAGNSIYMDDTAGISITELRSKCRRLKADSGLDFIMIDYLQLMTSEGRNENRQQEISTISRNLKALAKELDVPILALSQLSRDSEKSGRKPKLSDLREVDPEEEKKLKAQRKKVRYITIACFAVFFAVYFTVPSFKTGINTAFATLSQFDTNAVIEYLRGWGAWAAVVSGVLMVLQSIAAPIPAFLITLSNAAIFGWVLGAVLSWSTAMIGAALCFYIARGLGRDVVEKLTSKGAMASIDVFFERYGDKAILICRLLPFVSFDFVSYAAGLTNMSFWRFFIATGVGQLPATIVYSYVGGTLSGGVRNLFIGLMCLFALSIVIGIMKKIYNDKHKKEEELSAASN